MNAIITVTGGTGFIGAYLVRRLVAGGARVRLLARRPERIPAPMRPYVEAVIGDVRDRRALADAVRGSHTVLHLAACARAWSENPKEFTAVNVQAVEDLLELCGRHHVERMVHVSTKVTLPPFQPAPVGGHGPAPTPYESSKRVGEKRVEEYAAAGHHAVIVHPTRVYGPGPLNDANGVTKVVALYLGGRFRLRLADNDVLCSYVHADDVALGILLAAERGRSGAHYLLGGENASFRRLLEIVSEISGVHRGMVPLPPWAALSVARGAELWGRLGGRPFITTGWVRCFLEDHRVDIEPTRRELGYEPRSLRVGLAETIAWLSSRAEGREAA